MPQNTFPGFDVLIKTSNGLEYSTGIEKITFGVDVKSTVPTANITYNVSVEDEKKLLEKHDCYITIKNKMVVGNTPEEIFTINLTSVSQKSELIRGNPIRKNELEKVRFKIKYMDSECLKIINSRVGGLFENKTLSQIITSLYNKTNSKIKLNMDVLDSPGGGSGGG